MLSLVKVDSLMKTRQISTTTRKKVCSHIENQQSSWWLWQRCVVFADFTQTIRFPSNLCAFHLRQQNKQKPCSSIFLPTMLFALLNHIRLPDNEHMLHCRPVSDEEDILWSTTTCIFTCDTPRRLLSSLRPPPDPQPEPSSLDMIWYGSNGSFA